jgi:hypothetical protein
MGPRLPKQKLLSVMVLPAMDLMAIDYIGPITPVTPRGNRYIIVGGDYFSRYVVAKALPEAIAGESRIITCLNSIPLGPTTKYPKASGFRHRNVPKEVPGSEHKRRFQFYKTNHWSPEPTRARVHRRYPLVG